MKSGARRAALVGLSILAIIPTAYAQGAQSTATTGLTSRRSMVWADIGFQGWDIAFGYRRFFPTTGSAKPLAPASFGLQRVEPISAVF